MNPIAAFELPEDDDAVNSIYRSDGIRAVCVFDGANNGSDEEEESFVVVVSEVLLPGRKMRATVRKFDFSSAVTGESSICSASSGGFDTGYELASFTHSVILAQASDRHWCVDACAEAVAVAHFDSAVNLNFVAVLSHSGKVLKKLEGLSGTSLSFSCSKGGRFLAVGTRTGNVVLLRVSGRSCFHVADLRSLHGSPVTSISWHRSGGGGGRSGFFSTGKLGTIAFYTILEIGGGGVDVKGSECCAVRGEEHADGAQLATNVRRLDLSLDYHDGANLISSAVSPDGRVLAAASPFHIFFLDASPPSPSSSPSSSSSSSIPSTPDSVKTIHLTQFLHFGSLPTIDSIAFAASGRLLIRTMNNSLIECCPFSGLVFSMTSQACPAAHVVLNTPPLQPAGAEAAAAAADQDDIGAAEAAANAADPTVSRGRKNKRRRGGGDKKKAAAATTAAAVADDDNDTNRTTKFLRHIVPHHVRRTRIVGIVAAVETPPRREDGKIFVDYFGSATLGSLRLYRPSLSYGSVGLMFVVRQ